MNSPRWQLSLLLLFLLRLDLPANDSLKQDTLEICLAAEKVSGTETILGAQEIRGLWRVYPLTRTARNKLLVDNLTLRQQTVQVYNKNPFIVRGGSGEEVPVTQVWISDIPISVDGKDIETALVRLGCVLRSSLINEKIRNKDGKLTRFLTGRRFVFVNIPEGPLERTVKIGGFTARLYHKEQPMADPQRTTCSRCLERGHRLYHKEQPRADPQRATCPRCLERGHRLYHKEQPRADPQRATCPRCLERGHRVSACPNSIRSKECRQEGHKRGDAVCDAVSVWGPQGSVGQRGDTRVSNSRKPPTPRSPTPGNPRPSTRRPTTRLPAVTRTCRRSTTPHRNSHRQTVIGNQEDQG